MMAITMPQMIRKSDYFKQSTLREMVKMVASVNLKEEQEEWENELND